MDEEYKKDFDNLFNETKRTEIEEVSVEKVIKKKKQNVGKHASTAVLKVKIYEYIVKGYRSHTYEKLIADEFGLAKATVQCYVAQLNKEISEEYNSMLPDLRRNILLELIDMKNDSNNFWEKKACIDTIIKITGMGTENINITENREQDNLPKRIIIQLEEEKDDDKK